MKNLKSIILGLALLVVCGTVNANPVSDNESLTATHAVNTYVDAITRGKLAGLNEVLDQTVKFSMLRGKKMLSFDKKQMMEFFKGDKNVEQTCTTSTDIVESNADIKVVKVDMKYDGFTRSNYVTVTNTGDGWKITNVYSVFK
jgi:archaellum component FlaF (FlaF/FlaG flagellin family)